MGITDSGEVGLHTTLPKYGNGGVRWSDDRRFDCEAAWLYHCWRERKRSVETTRLLAGHDSVYGGSFKEQRVILDLDAPESFEKLRQRVIPAEDLLWNKHSSYIKLVDGENWICMGHRGCTKILSSF